ncbi:GNAT family N-acetyltransferase [Curtobacterium sp. MCBA15_012]|uniref:GNAT family N-acetyltransferase n=1 Tax=Curtobacterium sp. MCBA15_012 TaxID=1898738 RepID=UPI001587D4EE|nr:GNAT family N-acetyltransferase [Curtobacterium sp. MCBA15_012]WIA99356.1 GNAT family N-acetyltransferase [Curtobacterium sp. MCBA15_012]
MLPAEEIDAGDGISLTPLRAEDADDCFLACQDETVNRWIPLPSPYTRAIARSWCEGGAEAYRLSGSGVQFAIRLYGSFVGCMSLKNPNWREGIVEVSYWLAENERGKGIAGRAVAALSNYAFSVGFDRVELRVAQGNSASARVAQKAGFREEGLLRSAGVLRSGRTDMRLFSLLMTDVFK